MIFGRLAPKSGNEDEDRRTITLELSIVIIVNYYCVTNIILISILSLLIFQSAFNL